MTGHTSQKGGIIKYCNRPFATIELMNETLIREWNKVVGPDDTVYHLGDFTLGETDVAKRYILQLNGKIRFLRTPGHHDRHWMINECDGWWVSKSQWAIRLEGSFISLKFPELSLDSRYPQIVVLCHFPFAQWDRKHYGAWHLHGHSHGNYQGQGKILDVGVDSVNKIWGSYRPVSLAGVVEYMEGR